MPTDKEINEMFDGGYLSVSKVAKILHFSTSKVYQLIREKALKSKRFGNSRRVSLNSLREFVDRG